MGQISKVISKKSTQLEGLQKSFNLSIDKKIAKAHSAGNVVKFATLNIDKNANNAFYNTAIAEYKKLEADLLANKKTEK